jgi:hypothetical protein
MHAVVKLLPLVDFGRVLRYVRVSQERAVRRDWRCGPAGRAGISAVDGGVDERHRGSGGAVGVVLQKAA